MSTLEIVLIILSMVESLVCWRYCRALRRKTQLTLAEYEALKREFPIPRNVL